MRAIVKAEATPGVELREQWPEPQAVDDHVVIEVAATSLCGTDREVFEWSPSAQAFDPELPIVIGHECAGIVVAVGPAAYDVEVGDRVAVETHIFCGRCLFCRTGLGHNCPNMRLLGLNWDGGFARYMAVPERVCFRLPKELPLEQGALFEPAGVAVHALQRAGSVSGRSVLVSGCGPIGLLVVHLSYLFGATKVLAVEPNPYRRARAEELGAITATPDDFSVGWVRSTLGGREGAGVAFEASAAPNVLGLLLEGVERESRIITIGHPGAAESLDVARYINKKGIELAGVFGRRIWDTWELLADLVVSGRLDLSTYITHRLELDEIESAIELLDKDAIKVVIVP